MSIDNKTWRTEKRDPYTVYGRRRVGGRCERDNITWETRQSLMKAVLVFLSLTQLHYCCWCWSWSYCINSWLPPSSVSPTVHGRRERRSMKCVPIKNSGFWFLFFLCLPSLIHRNGQQEDSLPVLVVAYTSFLFHNQKEAIRIESTLGFLYLVSGSAPV